MSHRTCKMSLGFIAVAAVALMLAGNAWAGTIRFNRVVGGELNNPSPFTWSTGTQANNNTILFAYHETNGSTLFYQTGGAITNVHEIQMGYEEWAGTVITYALSGGSMTSSEDTNIGSNNGPNNGTFTLAVSGTGTYTGGATARLGDGGGAGAISVLDVSGSGTLTLNSYVQFGDTNSWLKVTGGNATIFLEHPWFGNDNGTGVKSIGGFVFTLDNSVKQISTVVCGDANFDLSNALNAHKIDIAAAPGLVTIGETFDLITIPQGRTIFVPTTGVNSLLNSGDTTDWALSIVENSGGKDILRLTALTPEPATMALLAIGGLGMLIRRRRSSK